ncbi:MAG: DMT family transporter [Proteobacteria bacterium]|nr:DMT family transporter [Pseudomonadota bacterium]
MQNSNDYHSFPVVAVMLIIATGTVLAGMDAFAKFLALEVPIIMVLWGRYFFHTVITFCSYSIKTRSLQFLRARRPGLQLIRALALFGATCFMYVAITRMPLGDAAAIQFLAPVLVTALSGLLLGEHVGPRRWMAVCARPLMRRPGGYSVPVSARKSSSSLSSLRRMVMRSSTTRCSPPGKLSAVAASVFPSYICSILSSGPVPRRADSRRSSPLRFSWNFSAILLPPNSPLRRYSAQ